ncbi:MAG: hypothetical protein IKP68_07935 [Clostridia bacterium]|nr:hypothetical protein [Clostridia bacterium]
MTVADHSKKYMVIDGHLITLSFSKAPNKDLFSRIKSILLSSGQNPHNCPIPADSDTMQKSDKGA